jgi:hypothetical protein
VDVYHGRAEKILKERAKSYRAKNIIWNDPKEIIFANLIFVEFGKLV